MQCHTKECGREGAYCYHCFKAEVERLDVIYQRVVKERDDALAAVDEDCGFHKLAAENVDLTELLKRRDKRIIDLEETMQGIMYKAMDIVRKI